MVKPTSLAEVNNSKGCTNPEPTKLAIYDKKLEVLDTKLVTLKSMAYDLFALIQGYQSKLEQTNKAIGEFTSQRNIASNERLALIKEENANEANPLARED